jgi:hypothetical protein
MNMCTSTEKPSIPIFIRITYFTGTDPDIFAASLGRRMIFFELIKNAMKN